MQRLWRSFDWVLLGTTVLLIVFGISMISSATRGTEDLANLWQRQTLLAVSGLALMLVVAAFDYRFYENLHRFLYILAVSLLVLVLAVGEISQGVQRWLGANAIQPSEFAKIVVIIGLARLLSGHEHELKSPRYLLLSLGYVLLPAALIYLQPNLSTALTLLFIWLAVVLMAGVPWLHIGGLAAAGVIASPIIWFTMQDYMRQRILLFIDPEGSPEQY